MAVLRFNLPDIAADVHVHDLYVTTGTLPLWARLLISALAGAGIAVLVWRAKGRKRPPPIP
jgi:hypothetical protein